MAKTIVSFQSADGKSFATELEADGHDRKTAALPLIQAYLDAAGIKAKATRGLLINQLPSFLVFADTFVAPVAVATPEAAHEEVTA